MSDESTSDLGPKLAKAIAAKQVRQVDVARAFKVTPATVSGDWIKKGRIAKKHYPMLVAYFGLPYEWWFGPAGADPKISAVVLAMVSMSEAEKNDLVRSSFPATKSSKKTQRTSGKKKGVI